MCGILRLYQKLITNGEIQIMLSLTKAQIKNYTYYNIKLC